LQLLLDLVLVLVIDPGCVSAKIEDEDEIEEE